MVIRYPSLPVFFAFVVLSCTSTSAFDASLEDDTRSTFFTVVLHRHGDRSPVMCLPSDDPTCSKKWPNGFSQLTGLGSAQGKALGRALAARYLISDGNANDSTPFLPSSYAASSVSFRATAFDRALSTTTAVAAGLFGGPTPSIPVESSLLRNDTLLAAWSASACPNIASAVDRVRTAQAAVYSALDARLNPYRLTIAEAAQVPVETVTPSAIWRINDAIIAYSSQNYSLPAALTPQIRKTIADIADEVFALEWAGEDTTPLLAGHFLHELFERLTAAATSTMQPGWDRHTFPTPSGNARSPVGPGLYVYGAHDTTVAPVLAALGVYDGSSPGYAASVVIELSTTDTTLSALKEFGASATGSVSSRERYQTDPRRPVTRAPSAAENAAKMALFSDVGVTVWYHRNASNFFAASSDVTGKSQVCAGRSASSPCPLQQFLRNNVNATNNWSRACGIVCESASQLTTDRSIDAYELVGLVIGSIFCGMLLLLLVQMVWHKVSNQLGAETTHYEGVGIPPGRLSVTTPLVGPTSPQPAV